MKPTNKTTALIAALLFLLSVPIMLAIVSNISRIHTASRSEREYHESLHKLGHEDLTIEDLRTQLTILQTKETSKNSTVSSINRSSDITAMIRTALNTVGIIPDRYQINGKYPDETIEFSFKTTSLPFIEFLKAESRRNTMIKIAFLSIKKNDTFDSITVVMRVLP